MSLFAEKLPPRRVSDRKRFLRETRLEKRMRLRGDVWWGGGDGWGGVGGGEGGGERGVGRGGEGGERGGGGWGGGRRWCREDRRERVLRRRFLDRILECWGGVDTRIRVGILIRR